MPSSSIQPITDELLVASIQRAHRRVFIIAPGVWPPVAEAIAEAWSRLGPERVGVILDVDPEVCRIGYGSLEGIEILQTAAMAANQPIAQEPGIRICVFIIDEETIVFSPTPRLIETPPGVEAVPPLPPIDPGGLFPPDAGNPEGEEPPHKANGIILGPPPNALEDDIGVGPEGNASRNIGLDNIDEKKLDDLKKDLDQNPPKNFDLSRAVNVYNAKLQFVELKVAGCKLSQHKARLPKSLIHVLKKNPQLEKKIENSIKLLDSNDDLISGPGVSQESVFTERERIKEEYLRPVAGVGTVIERARKKAFIEDLKTLEEQVKKFAEGIESELAERFERTAQEIAQELLEEVLANPPEKWRQKLGPQPSGERMLRFIVEELHGAFGTPGGKVGKMKVDVVYKDVTYDMLKEPDFQQQMTSYFPDLPPLEEYGAARERAKNATTESEE